MKVIKDENAPEEKSCDWTCGNCRAIIHSKLKEGRTVPEHSHVVAFNCPECGEKNLVALNLFKAK